MNSRNGRMDRRTERGIREYKTRSGRKKEKERERLGHDWESKEKGQKKVKESERAERGKRTTNHQHFHV